MTETYMERVEREIQTTLYKVKVDVSKGMSPTDAINKNAHTTESYAAMLKEYNLKPVIPD